MSSGTNRPVFAGFSSFPWAWGHPPLEGSEQWQWLWPAVCPHCCLTFLPDPSCPGAGGPSSDGTHSAGDTAGSCSLPGQPEGQAGSCWA